MFAAVNVPFASTPVSDPVGVVVENSGTAIGPAESATAWWMCAAVAPVRPTTRISYRTEPLLSSSNVAEPVAVVVIGVGRSFAPVIDRAANRSNGAVSPTRAICPRTTPSTPSSLGTTV